MKQILMVRHAISVSNAGDFWAGGPASIPLSREGETRAQALADSWVDPIPDQICCSTYTRSIQTAAPLATKFGLTLNTLSELREFTFWDFQWTAQEYESKRAEAAAYWIRLDPQEKAGGVHAESFLECLERAKRFRDFAERAHFTTCVCVSHGHFMHIFRAIMQGVDLPPREFMVYLRDNLVGNAYDNLQIEKYLISPVGQIKIAKGQA